MWWAMMQLQQTMQRHECKGEYCRPMETVRVNGTSVRQQAGCRFGADAAEYVAMTRTMRAGVGGMLFKSPVAWERVMNMRWSTEGKNRKRDFDERAGFQSNIVKLAADTIRHNRPLFEKLLRVPK